MPEADLALNFRVNVELFPVIRPSVRTNVLIFCVFDTDPVFMLSFNSEEVQLCPLFYFILFYFYLENKFFRWPRRIHHP